MPGVSPPAPAKKPARSPAASASAGDAGDGARSGVRWELMEQRVFEVASQLFSERGFTGTTLQDIADAMGVSRPALYYYVKSKEDILAHLVEEFPLRDAATLRKARTRKGVIATEKLHDMARLHVLHIADSPVRLRILERNEHHLVGAAAAAHAKAKRSVLAEFRAVIEEGIQSGEFRPIDARTAALAVLGMCNWVAWWFEPAPDNPPGPVADQIAEMAVQSVAIPSEQDRTSDPQEVLRQIRQGIERLNGLLPT